MEPWLVYMLLCLSAFVAGAINSVAGGGTLITYPALLMVMPYRAANVTSTVALVPGSFAGAWGYRNELQRGRRWLTLLLGPSILGGLAGALILVLMPADSFKAVIPWLLLTASLLFIVQPLVNRLLTRKQTNDLPDDEEPTPSRFRLFLVLPFQFLVGVYGGYFGAGIGILTLSALGLMGLRDIHRMNGLKTVLATSINAVSVAVFVFGGEVQWEYGLPMAVAAVAGGYCGARVSRKLPKPLVRWLVIAIGLGLTIHEFLREH